MSVSWLIGFKEKPRLEDLDKFMLSAGFVSEQQEEKIYTRVYSFFDKNQAPRPIEFFYEDQALSDQIDWFREIDGGNRIHAYGDLKTYSAELSVPNINERLKIIKEKKIEREHDCYKYLDTERLKFYETALAIRDRFDALVVSEQSGEEIDPNRYPFTDRELESRK